MSLLASFKLNPSNTYFSKSTSKACKSIRPVPIHGSIILISFISQFKLILLTLNLRSFKPNILPSEELTKYSVTHFGVNTCVAKDTLSLEIFSLFLSISNASSFNTTLKY